MKTTAIPTLTDEELDRLVTQVHRDPENADACWTVVRRRGGRAGQAWDTRPRFVIRRGGRLVGLDYSRLLYAIQTGEDLGAMTAEHVCGRGEQGCVSPHHVVPMTMRDNVLAPSSKGLTAQRARQTHCAAGHDFTDPGVLTLWTDDRGRTHRRCRPCTAKRRAERRAAR